MKIMPIGDSITQGGQIGSEYTYRLPLRDQLRDEGVKADYIGSRSAGQDPGFRWPVAFDSDHEGYYGQNTRDVVRQVETHLATLPAPDIALVHLGTNDSGWRARLDVIAPLKDLIGQLRQQNARVVVLVALPAKGIRAGGSVLRWQLRLMAFKASTRASPVIAVDQSAAAQAGATFDGVHPNPDGQRRMAGNWLASMQDFLPRPRP
ncbi:MAG: G-D-S-L family lipolytic protein [Rhizobiales bacterium]|nr:G-D-S-L family lipolytic protein [Rhizobacter sp.]